MATTDSTVHLLNEAYVRMTDAGAARDDGRGSLTLAFLMRGLNALVDMDDRHVYQTIAALDPGAQRLVAAQAIIELRELGFRHVPVDEEDIEADPLAKLDAQLNVIGHVFARVVTDCPDDGDIVLELGRRLREKITAALTITEADLSAAVRRAAATATAILYSRMEK